jgi:hypothetical protein
MRVQTRFTVVLFALSFAGGNARAQSEADKGQAREFGNQAMAAAERNDWVKAEDLFRRAEELYDAPTLLLGLARARTHLGKYVEAWEDYHRILVQPLPPNASAALRQAVEDARKEISTIEGKRGRLTITVSGPDRPIVTLDGVAIPVAALGAERPANPGSHVIHVEADGFEPSDTNVTVTPGAAAATATITLRPKPHAATTEPAPGAPGVSPSTATAAEGAPDPTRRTLGLVGIGVGGAGLILGAVTGIVAMGKHSTITSSSCATSAGCSASDLMDYQSTVSSYNTMGTLSTVGFIAGGVLAAAGAVIFFTAPKRERAASASGTASATWIAPYVGPGSVGAVGQF